MNVYVYVSDSIFPHLRLHPHTHAALGGLLVVAPGGVREAMTTTAEDNVVRWFGRSGFAEVARRTGAPIFPVFTKRMRDVFLVLGGGLPFVQRLCGFGVLGWDWMGLDRMGCGMGWVTMEWDWRG